MRRIEPDRARAAMVASYQAVTDDASKLGEEDLAVEATIHHLDLTAGETSLAGPSGPGLAVTRETLDGVLGQPVPAGWDDVTYALKATGRAELTDNDRASLGELATRLPLLG